MSRIQQAFERLNGEGRKALIPFITAGDPDAALTLPLLHTLVEAGADVIELGVPFSDPMADGPTIQRASERALAKGMTLRKVLQLVVDFRKTDVGTPVVLMGYANPIEAMGLDKFAQAAAQAGVDGVLVVDYPPEEAAAFGAAMKAQGMDPIFLLAPTSNAERIAQVAEIASGYVYYVSLAGVTGSGALNVDAVAERLPLIREKTGLPVGVGFGIRDAATAARIAGIADAVVVGSRIIEEIEKSTAENACANVKALVADIRRGVDEVKQ
ncbi:MAG: tryptophan synthase subunit alpha [Rhodocyclales bacterium GT-UBC]|nr:MAG: tryptophan synthase subunit alpha [Rhodocyclales bacterium GT-UBC]